MRAKYNERDLDVPHWMQLFVVAAICFLRKYKRKSEHALRPHFFYLLDYVTRRSENWDFKKKKKKKKGLEIQW